MKNKIFASVLFFGVIYSVQLSAQVEDRQIFQTRSQEKVAQLQDCITIIQSEKDIALKNEYIRNAENLFSYNAMVKINSGNKHYSIKVSEFLDNLLQNKYKSLTLDSIVLPVFDSMYFVKTDTLKDSLLFITVSGGRMFYFDNPPLTQTDMEKGEFFVMQEQTDGGKEFVAKLSDLYVTVSQPTKEKKPFDYIPVQVNEDEWLNMEVYRSKIKLVDEFMDRFNFKDKLPNLSYNSAEDSVKHIISLFDMQTLFADKTKQEFNKALAFAQVVFKDSVKLNYEDSLWYAKLKCKGKLSGKEITFYLYLTVENRKEDMYKWVITSAEAKEFSYEQSDPLSRAMIMPDDHETKFVSLKQIFKHDKSFITQYASKKFKANPLTVFVTLVNKGLLTFDYVEETEFYFLHVPDYIFSINYYEREEKNSGWLIKEVKEISQEERMELLKNLLYNNENKN